MNTKLQAVRVQEVILNNEFNPERYELLGNNDAIGTILYSKLNQRLPDNKSTDRLGYARPLFASITQYPVVNEIVYLVKGPSPNYYDNREIISYYLPAIKVQNHPLHNAFPNLIQNNNISLSNEETEAGATTSENKEYTINLGEYFKEIEKIRPLRPYEGDTIIEGRFGNTIRLGATTFNQLNDINRWSNEGNIGDPITIIRNGQKEDENKESFEHILEDIDNDNSSIYLCSNQQLTDFTPSSRYQLSFGGNIEAITKVEPIIPNDPLPVVVVEDIPPVTPPPVPSEPEEMPPEEVQEDIAEYDDALSDNQAVFPGDEIFLDAFQYQNNTGIDVERQLGPVTNTPPPIHPDALETVTKEQFPSGLQDGPIGNLAPYAFYTYKQGPFNRIEWKNKEMTVIYTHPRGAGSVSEVLKEAKIALSTQNGIKFSNI